MPTFIRSRVVQNEAVAAAGPVRTDDMPVNPLSMILFTIRAQNTAANAIASLANLLAVFTNITLVYKGQSLIAGTPQDLYAKAVLFDRLTPRQLHRNDPVNEVTWVTIPLLLGRAPFDAKHCFPAVRRGELQLQSTPAASFTNVVTPTLQIETLELLDATPEWFTKYTTITKTPTATGDHDVDLPIGNPILGTLLFGTTVPTGTVFTASIQQVRQLVDNVEYGYALTNWESLISQNALEVPDYFSSAEHIHRENTAGAYAQNAATLAALWGTPLLQQYALMDWDPTLDQMWQLSTEGRARVHLRINAGVADAIRVMPVERLAVGQQVKTAP